MQDDLIQKSLQLTSSKSQYHKKPDQVPYKNKTKKSKQNKTNRSNASEYLNFKIEKKKEPIIKSFKHQVQTNNEITLSPYYRFSLKPGDYSEYHSNPNLPIDWDTVRKVRILTDSEIKCPICLEEQLLVGRANKCGHYYCWPCIIRYMWVSDGKKRCPICNVSLRSIDLRPVSIQVYSHITEGDSIDLVLMKRPKGTISMFSAAKPAESTLSGFISSKSSNIWFNRISIYSDAEQDYSIEKEILLKALQETIDDFEKSSIQKALELLEKNFTVKEGSDFFHESESQGCYLFYQIADCRPYFLHPLNMAMLKKQFGSFELCPLNLHSKILEIERIHVTETEQRRYGQISHLGKNVVAYFVEVDLRGVVGVDVLNEYKPELGKRQKDRARFKRIEDKIQQKISIRRKNEEEANNLLMSYFENPVMAPVQKTVDFPEKKEEAAKEEEKQEESKSIWSRFGEVLKRPPREKIEKSGAEKDEGIEKGETEEEPKKLTMFDLIKNKSIK